jgi:adenylate cyclase
LERRLAAILAADIVSYSRLMGEDEEATLSALKSHREALVDPKIAEHHGRIVKTTGDGMLVEFPSVVEAVSCAVEIQTGMAERNAKLAEDRRMLFRIGINLGDVIVENGDLYGDGVNVAARLEALAKPGGICVRRTVRNQVRDKLSLDFEDMGEIPVKNIARPIRVFRILTEMEAPTPTKRSEWPWLKPVAIATVLLAITVVGAGVWLTTWRNDMKTPPISSKAYETSIAVLPFDNMSGDLEQDYFSDGITEDLITDISRISGLFVIARNTMFTYKGRAVNVQEVGRELGVRYILEGSVRKAGDQVRINAQLIDVEHGQHLWSDRFDRHLTDIFALQDEITRKIVTALAVELTGDEEIRLGRATQVDPEAYDMLLRGLEHYRRYTQASNADAREFFKKAIALDPQFARAYADLALTYYYDAAFGSGAPEEPIGKAAAYAQMALDLDDSLPQLHFALSDIYRMQGRHDDAIAAARRAIALDPNYADGYGVLGLSLIYAGEPEAGLEAIREAMRLNPRHPFFYVQNLGHAYFLMGQYEKAVPTFERVIERNPHFLQAHLLLAAAYSYLGRTEDAEWEVAEVETLSPGFSIKQELVRAQYKRPADLERYIGGLRKAGLPE